MLLGWLFVLVLVGCGDQPLVLVGQIRDAHGPVAGARLRAGGSILDLPDQEGFFLGEVESGENGRYQFEYASDAPLDAFWVQYDPPVGEEGRGASRIVRYQDDMRGTFSLVDLVILEWDVQVEREPGRAVVRWTTDVERPDYSVDSLGDWWLPEWDDSTSREVLVLNERLVLLPTFGIYLVLNGGTLDADRLVHTSPRVLYETEPVDDLARGASCTYASPSGELPLEVDGACPITDRRSAEELEEPAPWVTIDLGSPQPVAQVSVLGSSVDVDVLVSSDGDTFAEFGVGLRGTGVASSIEPVPARYVRIAARYSSAITRLVQVGVF